MNNLTGLNKTKKLTVFSILTALVIVLQVLGGGIKIGAFSLNLTLVPIVCCSMILGAVYSAFLGAIVGIVILILGIVGVDPFTGTLFNLEPVIIILTCILKTGLAGLISAFIYKAIKNKYVATFITSFSVPIINTSIFVLFMLLIKSTLISNGYIDGGTNAFIGIILTFVGVNFFFELAVNVILAPAIFRVFKAIFKE